MLFMVSDRLTLPGKVCCGLVCRPLDEQWSVKQQATKEQAEDAVLLLLTLAAVHV